MNIHYLLSKAAVKARPTVLWCYKQELDFSVNKKKRLKKMKKQAQQGLLDPDKSDPFELFIQSTSIRYCFYKDTHKILGNTFGMCVLQDFESITPNVLARTIETVEGGGCVLMLLRSMQSLRQLYTMVMDVHARFRTASSTEEGSHQITGRFVERFILSLGSCPTCLVCDEELNILPISSHIRSVTPLPPVVDGRTPKQVEFDELKASLEDSPMIHALVKRAKTLDQAKALLIFMEAITEKTLRSTVALTAARGRGKSSSLGLAVAYAIGMGYSNIFVSSPHPENLKTFFEFVFQGFDALELKEHQDYDLLTSTNDSYGSTTVVRVNVFRTHRQTIQYIHPSEAGAKLGQAELVVVDEAAAIPLPLVRGMFGSHLMFLSSTVNGYEGTGRALSLKLIKGLRDAAAAGSGRVLKEVTLEEPIRYADGDPVESWLNKLLCLDSKLATPSSQPGMCPHPSTTMLYYVNKDALFSFHKSTETFLQRMVALFVSSHYKNTPNDLMLMSDAPTHHLFVLLGPINTAQASDLPEILCAVQVAVEGGMSDSTVIAGLNATGKTDNGDLIPWIISQQYQDPMFGQLHGARVVRIATHPNYQGMGYGSRALDLLHQYFNGGFDDPTKVQDDDAIDNGDKVSTGPSDLLHEVIKPRKLRKPLLSSLPERKAEQLDYLGVSFGVTDQLYRFWQRSQFVPLYVRLTTNEITGEHSCIMVRAMSQKATWLPNLATDFRRRFTQLLGFDLRRISSDLAQRMLGYDPSNTNAAVGRRESVSEVVKRTFSPYDRSRVNAYARAVVDYHVVLDLVPTVAALLVTGAFGDALTLNWSQAQVLVGIGLQKKLVDELATEMQLTVNQVMAYFNKAMRKVAKMLQKVDEDQAVREVEEEKAAVEAMDLDDVDEDVDDNSANDVDDNDIDLGDEYAVPRDDDEHWNEALRVSGGRIPSEISVKRKKTIVASHKKKKFKGKSKK